MKVKRRKRYRLRKGGFLWRLTRITPYLCLVGFLVFAAQFGGVKTKTALAVELPQPIEYKLVDLPELPPKYDVPLSDDLVSHIIDVADENNLDPELILAIIKQERSDMGNLRKKRRRKIAQHKRKKMLKAMRHKNK